MDRKNAIIALLVVLLIFCTATSYLSYQQQQHMIAAQGDIIEKLISARNNAGTTGRAENPAFINGSEAVSNSSANIVAVRSDTHSGVIGKVYVELKDGKGDVLVNTNPFVEPDTQYSVREGSGSGEERYDTFPGAERSEESDLLRAANRRA